MMSHPSIKTKIKIIIQFVLLFQYFRYQPDKFQNNSIHHSLAISSLEDITEIVCRFSKDEKLVSCLF